MLKCERQEKTETRKDKKNCHALEETKEAW